ncbi:uncharacterized protein MELLADRAFT_106838 [Melampsora larici-populina 98AG31]|uniref:Uncharacterized protein n=1 Tax=Melampsora larici-populina (strain 98AG31 / pathotype 3-4-7) TaxID=747676 RepID=F4RMT1_MELLP|nr:uncharacterized protein MELLADRAFT_106838 [Melampsora larici-populina 98AG31]EGG06164.1 hypothetical protein MELLADRAFT_106838 [Melampsora larici-populina 98AG31]
MENPAIPAAAVENHMKVGVYLGSWEASQLNKDSGPVNTPPSVEQKAPTNVQEVFAHLKREHVVNHGGSDHVRFKDPKDSTEWIAACKEGQTNVDIYKPPLLPAFKTFVKGSITHPGYVEFPDDPPPVGFMAIKPGPSAQTSPALA